jgi:putative CocE/NonD family hydrolase
MAAWDLWEDLAAEGGAFRLDWPVSWAMQLGALRARAEGDAEGFARLRAAAMAPPVHGPAPALPELAGDARVPLAGWVARAADPGWWRARSPALMLGTAAMATPALTVGGWFDLFLTGSVAAHDAMRAAGAPARLVIGPWPHIGWQRGGISVDRLTVSWFDRFLKGVPNGADDGPALLLHDLTRGEWRGFDAWPRAEARFWLTGDGLAAAGSTGHLAEAPPGGSGTEVFVHDPWRPVPARGLHLAPPFGMADRADLDARADVAVFTSAPLAAPLRLAGAGRLTLAVQTDAAAFDLHAVLSVVGPDGTARSLTSAMRRHPAAGGTVTLAFRPVAATLDPGERLRLSLAGACFPAFAVNPGTGAPPETTGAAAHRPITLALATPAPLDLRIAP